jgi:hypothetical protein
MKHTPKEKELNLYSKTNLSVFHEYKAHPL